ncbi:nitronate monooxygenase [Virgibacillus sp. MSP4-1]|uniref:NAD(P)H-dependent flavin oxidoreductase n=1 Tax=Virgibacillus sp. MSP4-1 TaxID=2700081 RepID=UPI0003A3F848|nr:nitronate monooxygenase [Virgibacillus sp. MSP4-1]QHS23188.1 nitronate monooxygenase [Virgibacillus sp. MSP4-1]
MNLKTKVTERLRIQYPVIQAPMAGGITTSELVAEVSNTGGLGMIGAGYMTPDQVRKQIREIKELTGSPFGVNLFVPNEFDVTKKEWQEANQALQPIRNRLNIPDDKTEAPAFDHLLETFHEQLNVIQEEEVPICSFTFGIPSKDTVEQLKRMDSVLIGTATTVQEAVEIERSGMDIVVVQGSEAGGHRGNFSPDHQEGLIGLMSLIPQVVDQVQIPVIAAGGIMDGRGLMASLCLGADGVQMGTAFLTCKESGANPLHKQEILQAREDQVVLTRSFSGKWARGIHNQFIYEFSQKEDSIPDYPVQNSLTKGIRKASASQGNPEYMSLWSGQSPRLTKDQTAKTLMERVITEAKQISVE